MPFKSISGSRIIGQGQPQAVPIQLDPAPYTGAIAYGSDGNVYVSNGTAWSNVGSGATGVQGLQGDDGLQGTQGTYGPGFNIIGSVTDVDAGGDQQATLNTAFGSATTGQGVIDNADDELWVYDGSVWVNVGSFRGVQGFDGNQGVQGNQGTIGEEGIQGSRGFRGNQGVQGFQGTTGIQGMQGIQGLQGLQGPQGTQGVQGNQGVQGLQGDQGVQGVQGPQAFQGIQGDNGFQGFSGDDSGMVVQYNVGHTFVEPSPATSGFMVFNSPTADTGALTGATKLWIADSDTFNIDLTGYFNAIDLSSSTNKGYMKITLRDTPSTYAIFSIQELVDDGNYFELDVTYLSGNGNKEDFVSEDLPSNPGTYISLPCIVAFDISGDRGFQGIQGTQGLQGATGIQGDIGFQGVQGPQSIQGTQGIQGLQGILGFQGTQGTQGLQGLQGTQSVQGIQGLQGLQGGTGVQGIQGIQSVQGVQGVQGGAGLQGVQGLQGDQGVQGVQGAVGHYGGLTYEWEYLNNSTASTFPGTSKWKINNADVSLATVLTLDDIPLNNYTNDVDEMFDWLQAIPNGSGSKGLIIVESFDDGNGPGGHHQVVYEFTNFTWDGAGQTFGWFDVTYVGSYGLPTLSWQTDVIDTLHPAKTLINFVPRGEAGTQGVQGIQGVQGLQGLQGVQGTQGPQSIQGTTGIQGMQGTQGAEGARTFVVTNVGASDYLIDGVTEPTIHLIRGFTYIFDVNAAGHPFEIRVSNGGSAFNDGVTGNASASGLIYFRVPFDAPASLYYQCTAHAQMGGDIVTSDLGPQGTQGVQGVQGVQGIQGLQGFQGAGNQGIQGLQGTQGIFGEDGVQGFPGPIGPQGVQGILGTQGTLGLQGQTGSFGGITFDYTFSSDTATSDPGVGTLKFNNASFSSAGNLYMDDRDDNFTDIQPFLRTIDDSTSPIKGHFKVSENGSPENFAVFTITSVQEVAGYFNIICSFVNGSVTSFADGLDVVITFARTGDIGPVGSQGVQGVQGDLGIQGLDGGIGTVGAQGTQGVQGLQGAQGFQGNSGPQGVQGAGGFQGADGQTGDEGEVGGDGAQGIQGSFGLQGGDGFQGVQGVQGDRGLDGIGASGIQGNDGFQGVQGPQAAQGIQGITGPIGFGVQGIQGTQGFQGEAGFQGFGGFQGISGEGNQGTQGTNGFQGFQGDNGFQGSTGEGNQGTQGFQGAAGIGDEGLQGIGGFQGTQGIVGGDGGTGLQGFTGFQGFQGFQGLVGGSGDGGAQGTQGIQGDLGQTGPQGITGQGVQGMQGTQGVQGDFGIQGAIGGGVQGFQGTEGFQGDYGFQGTQGVQGPGNEGGVGNLQNIHTSPLQDTALFIPFFEAGADQRQLLATLGPNPGGEQNFFYTSNVDELSVENIAVGGNLDVVGSVTVGGSLTGITSDMNLPDDVYFGFGSNNVAKLGFESFASNFLMDIDTTTVNNIIIEQRSSGNAIFTFNTVTGDFTATGDVTTNSDVRLKENIVVIGEALEKVTNMRGVYFNKKNAPDIKKIGLIAQEVEAIIPEAVTTDTSEEHIKSVAYGSLVGLLIEAIKDLNEKVEDIKQ